MYLTQVSAYVCVCVRVCVWTSRLDVPHTRLCICVYLVLWVRCHLTVAPYVSQVFFEYKRDLLVSDSFAKELYLCADSSRLLWIRCHLSTKKTWDTCGAEVHLIYYI